MKVGAENRHLHQAKPIEGMQWRQCNVTITDKRKKEQNV
jgi:hypothetical protein